MNFASDNVTGICPEILQALIACNDHSQMPYGDDVVTEKLTARFSDLFEKEVAVFPVATGTAANALALSVLSPPYGKILCHAESHIHVDECCAPEFFTSGAKLIPVAGADGKLTPDALVSEVKNIGMVHAPQPAVISLTQSTETGTVYSIEEIEALCDFAHQHQLAVHMDGARFANAVVSIGCTPAEMTWKSGVDVLCFGATKNGAMAAEAVVFFDPRQTKDFIFRRKRAGHLLSKMRYVSAQLEAYLQDDLWLKNAAHANEIAIQLAEGLASVLGSKLAFPVEANEIFVRLPEHVISALEKFGFRFYRWEGVNSNLLRLVTAFNTRQDDVERLIQAARNASTENHPAITTRAT